MAAPERGKVTLHPHRTRPLVTGRTGVHPLVLPRRMGTFACPGARARRIPWADFSRRHKCARPSKGGGGCAKGGSTAKRDHREALGRSRGGYGTKVCVIADGQGRAIAFRIAPGQAHELTPRRASDRPATCCAAVDGCRPRLFQPRLSAARVGCGRATSNPRQTQ